MQRRLDLIGLRRLESVGGYTQEAMAEAGRLRASHPGLRVHVVRNSLVGEGGTPL